jgi:hypothetical protein
MFFNESEDPNLVTSKNENLRAYKSYNVLYNDELEMQYLK